MSKLAALLAINVKSQKGEDDCHSNCICDKFEKQNSRVVILISTQNRSTICPFYVTLSAVCSRH